MLFAAGLGTRLKPFTDHHPKALARVKDKTLLELAIRYLQRYNITEVLVNVHHFADQIEQVLADNNGFGSHVTISDERNEVLETGGGLKKAAWFFEAPADDFVVLNVDILTNLNLSAMLTAHRKAGAEATLAVMQRSSSRELLFNEDMRLCGWRNNSTGAERVARSEPGLKGFAFSGIHVLHSNFLKRIRQQGKFSIIDTYLDLAAETPIYGYDHSGDALIDVGKPESLAAAAQLLDKMLPA
jgi:NDP-sugar pyrophosphorylase family protein